MMADVDYATVKQVGKASYDALMYAKGLVKVGAPLLEVADKVEKYIKDKGFGIAFPINLSINQQAAHYTPAVDDKSVFTDKDVVKVDFGAKKGGYLGDCAVTVDLTQENGKLVECSEKTLEAAISKVRAGAKLHDIGKEVEKIAESMGFNPIRNLGGHGVENENLHASIFIPNYDNGDETELEEGQVIAIETFITTGEGAVHEGEITQIFQQDEVARARSSDTRDVSAFIDKQFGNTPFALRWLIREFGSEFKVKRAMNELMQLGVLEAFPVLIEHSNGQVAQTEKEMIVEKDSCTIVTS